MSQMEFLHRLPNFNIFENNNMNNNIIEEDKNKILFRNNIICPINEILLGDLNIVENHLKDFKYSPLKIFEMIRGSEMKRGVDLKMEFMKINNKYNCINYEAYIYSQRLGIKLSGYGKSREDAGNICALKMLTIIFKNKFKTYFELNDYFEYKNKNYLDIILIDEEDKNNNNNDFYYNNKTKKIEGNHIFNKNSFSSNNIIGLNEDEFNFFKGYQFFKIDYENNSNTTNIHEKLDNNFEKL